MWRNQQKRANYVAGGPPRQSARILDENRLSDRKHRSAITAKLKQWCKLTKKVDDIREVFKSIKHRKRKQIYCPRCCSPKLKLTSSLAVWLTGEQYYCEDCGYVGAVVMELEEEKEETDASAKEK